MTEPLTLMQRSLVGVIVLLGSVCAWRYGEINIPARAAPLEFAAKLPITYRPPPVRPRHGDDYSVPAETRAF